MGRLVCREFAAEHIPFVVVEKNADLADKVHGEHALVIHGDATLDDTLRQAGIDRAERWSRWSRPTRTTCTSR